MPKKPASLLFNNCHTLTSILLEPFLHEGLEVLHLDYCSRIGNETLSLIEQKCPQLKTLSLVGCRAITEMNKSYWNSLSRFPLEFPHLTHFDLSHCSNLRILQLEALSLQTLLGKHNPQLKSVELTTCFAITNFAHSPQVKLSHKQEAFGKKMWEDYFGDVGIEPPLPPDILKILNSPCPFWSGKKVKETHMLVLIPASVNGKPLTMARLGELVKAPKQGNASKYGYLDLGEYKDIPVSHSYWVLMTRDVLEGTRSKTYSDQTKIVNEFRQRSRLPYEVPHLLDAAVCIFMIHASTGIKLYGQNPLTYTRCQEASSKDSQLCVGGFASPGLGVLGNRGHPSGVGVSCLRKF